MTRTHKVGTLTLGITLIFFGILFLIHMFFPVLSYQMIWKLWPCIFILMGLEVLTTKLPDREALFVYDKGSVFLLILMTFLATGLAFLDTLFEYQKIFL